MRAGGMQQMDQGTAMSQRPVSLRELEASGRTIGTGAGPLAQAVILGCACGRYWLALSSRTYVQHSYTHLGTNKVDKQMGRENRWRARLMYPWAAAAGGLALQPFATPSGPSPCPCQSPGQVVECPMARLPSAAWPLATPRNHCWSTNL